MNRTSLPVDPTNAETAEAWNGYDGDHWVRWAELYDLRNDPHEMENLFDSSPEKKNLLDMIKSRPHDALPRRPQVGMA